MIEFCPRKLGMTLEQLRIFVTVPEYEHMPRAAGSLNLTQSAICRAEENQATGRSKSRPLELHQARRAHL